jgi:hypothetical protein
MTTDETTLLALSAHFILRSAKLREKARRSLIARSRAAYLSNMYIYKVFESEKKKSVSV